MKKLRKDERKASSRQYAAKRFMVLNAYLQIAYYLRPMRDGILQIFYFRHFSPGPDLEKPDSVKINKDW